MNIDHLIKMANDIGAFFAAESDTEEAVRGIAQHLTRFWDPRMRRQIVAHWRTGGEGLREPVKRAVELLAEAERVSG